MKKIIPFLVLVLLSCGDDIVENKVIAVGAMKDVMWKGELEGIIRIDTITPKEGLYGLGPLAGLQGELLINDGELIVSTIEENNRIKVAKNVNASAPFFVYANNLEWQKEQLTKEVRSVKEIETYLNDAKGEYTEPFVFKLKGSISKALIHVQNLPDGTKVTNPKEAHQGQVDVELGPQAVEIIGFYSTRHQRVFTHHDSFIHMHLISDDGLYMGHLDEVEVKDMSLYLPSVISEN